MTKAKAKTKVKLTRKERVWVYKHAKKHVIDDMRDVLTEEHHSHVTVRHTKACEAEQDKNADVCICNARARAETAHALVMKHMERWFKAIHKERMKDHL